MSLVSPMVRAVIVNWNGGRHVLGAVEALLATDWPADRLRVVVVDNASSDGSDREIEARFPTVDVRRTGKNLGFPGNNRAMADLAGVDYCALVNNDAFVTPSWLAPLVDALEHDPSLGAASPKIVFAPRFVDLSLQAPPILAPGDSRELALQLRGVEVDGADRWKLTRFGEGCYGLEGGTERAAQFRWLAGRATLGMALWETTGPPVHARLLLSAPEPVDVTIASGAAPTAEFTVTATIGPEPTWVRCRVDGAPYDVLQNAGSDLFHGGFGGDRGFLQRDEGQLDGDEDVWAWCGGAVLLRREYLQEVGLFDERFFMYYEDSDLAWRGRARGWRYRYVPGSVVRHLHATSSVEGSSLFEHYVQRNRLVMLTKNAPARLVVKALADFASVTAASAWQDTRVSLRRRRPPRLTVARRRLRSLGGYLRLAPALLADRRRLRRSQTVQDAEILRWMKATP